MKQAIPTSRNIWFDLFRFVLVYFVVSIHYNGGSPYAPLFRLAVPMFFMMSGFFIYTEDKTKREGKAINFIKNSFQYLLAATIIYVCYDVVKLIVNNGDVINYLGHRYYTDFVKGFIIQNRPLTSGYHLWFLIAFFLCSVIHYLFTKFELCDLYIFIVPIALMISMCCGGYLKAIYHYPLALSYTRNAFYMGFPMFALGYILGKLKFTEFKPWQTLLLGMGAVGSLFFSPR